MFGQFTTDFTAFSVGTTTPAAFKDRVDYYTLYYIYLFIGRLGLTYIANVSRSTQYRDPINNASRY